MIDNTSLVIFDLVLAATSDGFPKTLILFCCMTAVVVMLTIIAVRISKMRKILMKIAHRLGFIEKYHIYTIFDKKMQECDGTESTTEEFQYVSMQS